MAARCLGLSNQNMYPLSSNDDPCNQKFVLRQTSVRKYFCLRPIVTFIINKICASRTGNLTVTTFIIEGHQPLTLIGPIGGKFRKDINAVARGINCRGVLCLLSHIRL